MLSTFKNANFFKTCTTKIKDNRILLPHKLIKIYTVYGTLDTTTFLIFGQFQIKCSIILVKTKQKWLIIIGESNSNFAKAYQITLKLHSFCLNKQTRGPKGP